MKTIIIIFSLFLTTFNNASEVSFERDCTSEASRVYDLAYYYTEDPTYAFIQSAQWRSNCELDNSTSTEPEITAPLLN